MRGIQRKHMTPEKQLARAKEYYSDATLNNLNHLRFMANAKITKYILYGIK
jgi:hypothetical protein